MEANERVDDDPWQAFDDRLGLLVTRLREVAAERDALLREIDALRERSAAAEFAARNDAAAGSAFREAAAQVSASLRGTLEELRAD